MFIKTLAFMLTMQPVLAESSIYYFAYGSNLNYEFLKERFKNGPWKDPKSYPFKLYWEKEGVLEGDVPIDLGVYYLPDYIYTYSLDMSYFGRAKGLIAACITPMPNSKVYGRLYKISKEQMEMLDRSEFSTDDFNPKAYNKELVTVYKLDSKQKESAFVYVANPAVLTDQGAPDPRYERLITTTAYELNFPEDYIMDRLNFKASAVRYK